MYIYVGLTFAFVCGTYISFLVTVETLLMGFGTLHLLLLRYVGQHTYFNIKLVTLRSVSNILLTKDKNYPKMPTGLLDTFNMHETIDQSYLKTFGVNFSHHFDAFLLFVESIKIKKTKVKTDAESSHSFIATQLMY